MVIELRDVQFIKAPYSKLVIWDGIVNDVNLQFPEKASLPIVVAEE